MKVCTLCSLEKNTQDFPIRSDTGKQRSQCKDCYRIKMRKYKYPETHRRWLDSGGKELKKAWYDKAYSDPVYRAKKIEDAADYYEAHKHDSGFKKGRVKRNFVWRRTPAGRFGLGRKNARQRNLSWTITKEEYTKLISEPCGYCGYYRLTVTSAGLDRIDNRLGYDPGNVVACCKRCNNIKGFLEGAGFRFPRTLSLMMELKRNGILEGPGTSLSTKESGYAVSDDQMESSKRC